MTPYYQDDLVTLYNADSLARPELWRGGCAHQRSSVRNELRIQLQ